MPLGVVMIIRVEYLPPGVNMESLGLELANALQLSPEPCEDFGLAGPIISVDMDYLRDDLRECPQCDENYISSGLWLDVNLWKSYFGHGYERGDMPLFFHTAQWLESRLPNCDVYYGEDCTSTLRPFDHEYRSKLLRYYEKIRDLNWRSKDPEIQARLKVAWEESN